MNTKLLPAILALVAGFITCVMSFVQNVDIDIFTKRFIVVCVVFFVIGMIIRIVIDMNFKEMATEDGPEKMEKEESEFEESDKDEKEEVMDSED